MGNLRKSGKSMTADSLVQLFLHNASNSRRCGAGRPWPLGLEFRLALAKSPAAIGAANQHVAVASETADLRNTCIRIKSSKHAVRICTIARDPNKRFDYKMLVEGNG